MIVKTGTELLGPFKTVETLADRLRCDNTDLPFSVIGSYELINNDSIIPLGESASNYTYNGTFAIRKPCSQIELTESINKKIAQVDSIYQSKMYCSTPATFPNGVKNIQLRNTSDYNFFLSSYTEALTFVVSGTPNTQVIYRTEDNVTQTLTAQQMVVIGQAIKTLKTSIATSSWAHKDAIRALTTVADVNNYDLTIGWQ